MRYFVKQEMKIKTEDIRKIATLLERKINQEKINKRYASTKEVLLLLGKGILLTFSLVAPNLAQLLKLLEEKPNQDEWKKFNLGYLKRTLERLNRQKLIEIIPQKNKTVVKITEAGKTKILKYALEELTIEKQTPWDEKWRIVLYDIPNQSSVNRDHLRKILKTLGFLEIQKSVYLTPFPCEDQIDFLKSIFGLDKYIKLIIAEKIEDEKPFKDYFGL